MDDFAESAAMLVYAMKRRRCYLTESSQQFNSTAGLMLDGNEPPSTHFCIPQVDSNCKMSFAGDPIGVCVSVCVCVLCVCVHTCIHMCMCMCILFVIYNILYVIKTHDSESRGQEEAAIIRETKNTRPLSELFTRKTVQKITTALTKPP